MTSHTSDKTTRNICKIEYFHVRGFRTGTKGNGLVERKYSSLCAVVGSSLDYCNARPAGMFPSKLEDCFARVATVARRRDHVKPVLICTGFPFGLESDSISRRSFTKSDQATSHHTVRTSSTNYRPSICFSSMTFREEPPVRSSAGRRCFPIRCCMDVS